MTTIRNLPTNWLGNETSIAGLNEHLAIAQANGMPEKVLEHLRDVIAAISCKYQSGDVIRWFNSGADSFQRMCGTSGLAILRDGEVHRAFMLIMS